MCRSSRSHLSEEQRELRDWVHGFADDVVRPAAAEWDEREETPWPIIQEAAKIGLYSFDFLANAYDDPTGLSGCIANEELFWGDAGIAHGHHGHRRWPWRPSSARAPRTRWSSGCRSASATRPSPRSARSARPSPRPAPTSRAMRTRARYDEATRRVGPQWTEGVRHQRRHRQRARGDRVGRSRSWARRGQAAFVVPPGTPGLRRHQEAAQARACAPRTPPTCSSTTSGCPAPACSAGARRCRPGWTRPVPASGPSGQASMRTFELSRPTVGAQALGIARAAYEYALEYARTRVQFGRPIIENQAHRVRPGRHADRDRRRPAAGLAGRLDGPQQPAVHRRRGLDVQAEGGRGRGRGDREGGPDPRRRRVPARAPGASAGTATRRSTPSSRAPARSSAWSWPARSPGHPLIR